jgi:hypothetical protein
MFSDTLEQRATIWKPARSSFRSEATMEAEQLKYWALRDAEPAVANAGSSGLQVFLGDVARFQR